MKQYFVEGLFIGKKAGRRKSSGSTNAEPFARSFWASNPAEAAQMATEALGGGYWIEGPHVGATTEEQRMRAIGAPELPGFGASPKKTKGGKSK